MRAVEAGLRRPVDALKDKVKGAVIMVDDELNRSSGFAPDREMRNASLQVENGKAEIS